MINRQPLHRLKLLTTIILLLRCFTTSAQSIFTVRKLTRTIPANFGNNQTTRTGFEIVQTTEGPIDTIQAIKELLLFKGDTRLCDGPIMCYNPLVSRMYSGEERYSLQVQALFKINQLIMESPFFYASSPVLVDNTTGETATISGKIINEAFTSYEYWFEKWLKNKDNSKPLDSANVRWF